MIDFRYHLVSLISVFLALALGIVVGTTKLNGKVLDDLRGQVHSLKNDKRSLQNTERSLEQQLKSGDQFATKAAPGLVADRLKGDTVAIIAAPGADNAAKDSVQKMVEVAGGTVVSRYQLTDDYIDPRRASDLQNFVTGNQPPGFDRPDTDDPGELAGALLSYITMSGHKSGPAPSGVEVSQVLSGFSGLGMLRLESSQVKPAQYAVLVTGNPPSGDTASAQVRTLIELAEALDKAGRGTVVIGGTSSAEDAGVIGTIRRDDDMMGKLSTIDNADTNSGQISVVFALNEQGDGNSGQYGLSDNAQDQYPAMDR